MSKKISFGLVMALLYFVSAGGSYLAFSSMNSTNSDTALVSPEAMTDEETAAVRSRVNPGEPKTVSCPINGEMFTKSEEQIWATRRPLAVMIENHVDARPQSGLSNADVVYETLAEGGITRFMGIYYCGAAGGDVEVGPVRSARTYFLDWVSEYGENPIYAHVGGGNCNKETGSGCANGAKADAIGQIAKYGWRFYNDIDGLYIGLPVFKRDNRLEKFTGNQNIAVEHTMYSSTDKLYAEAEKRGLTSVDEDGVAWNSTFVPWKFKEDSASANATATDINYMFWEQFADSYLVDWKYDSATNRYLRNNGGQPHIDLNTEKQISAKTVILQVMKESRANDGYENNIHLLYANKGTGKAMVFQDGTVTEGTWKKADRTSRTVFYDKAGKEIALNKGQVWISTIPAQSESMIKYQ